MGLSVLAVPATATAADLSMVAMLPQAGPVGIALDQRRRVRQPALAPNDNGHPVAGVAVAGHRPGSHPAGRDQNRWRMPTA
jgi:hypothetical protein